MVVYIFEVVFIIVVVFISRVVFIFEVIFIFEVDFFLPEFYWCLGALQDTFRRCQEIDMHLTNLLTNEVSTGVSYLRYPLLKKNEICCALFRKSL